MIAATKYRAINLQESIHVPCRRRHVLCPALCTQLIQTFHLSLFVSYFNNLKIAYVLQEMLRLLVVLLLRPTYCTAWDTGGAGWKADPTRPQESQTNAVVCGSSSLEYEYVPSPAFFFYHSCWQFCVLKQRTDLLPALQPVEYRPAEGCNVDQSNSSTRTWLGAWDYIPVAGGYPDGWVRENDS